MENSSLPIKLGIIGAGHIGNRHGHHAARLPDAVVTAVADTHFDKAQVLAHTLNAVPFDNTDKLLQTDVDAVIVAVPTVAHRALVEQALAAGKHVLCEKPLALTLSECDTLITAAQIADKNLTVGHVLRFFPEYANAKRQVEGGAIGEVAAVRLRHAGRYPTTPWFADVTQSGGILLDLLVHEFDFLLWCFGPVVRVHARTLTDKKFSHLDYALVTLRHASGVIAHVEGVWGEPGGTHTTFEIAGDGGMLSHDSRLADTLRTATHSPEGTGRVVLTAPLAPQDDPYYQQLAAFVNGVRNGTAPVVTAQEARQAIAVALAVGESVRTGQAVTVGGGKS
jgi:predicted dehydrogenase